MDSIAETARRGCGETREEALVPRSDHWHPVRGCCGNSGGISVIDCTRPVTRYIRGMQE